MHSIALTREQLDSMTAYVKAHAPFEACGLLAGKNATVETIFEIENQARSPVRFVMDPIQQLNAFEKIDTIGQELLGIFHSHPAGPETVSPTDIAEAAYAVAHVILSQKGGIWKTRAFWIEDGGFREIEIKIATKDIG